MSEDLNQKIAKIFSTVFEREISVNDNLDMNDCDDIWTSLKHIELIVMLEEEFDISFAPELIPELTSQQKILEEIKKVINN